MELPRPHAHQYETTLCSHYTDVRAYLHALCNDYQLAEDLTQESYLRAHTFMQRNAPPQRPGAWLRRIAHNLAVNYFQSQRGPVMSLDVMEAVEVEANGMGPLDTLINEEAVQVTREAVYTAVNGLRPADRDLITRYYLDGMPASDCGRMLTIPAGSLRIRLFRARARLRTTLRMSR